MPDTTGIKHDTGKDPWHLVPWDALRGCVKVLLFGATKYEEERNWEKGAAWSKYYSAALRHATAWWNREGVDPETGYSHLWHLGCCVLFLITYELRGIGTDDRPPAGALPPGWKYTADDQGGELFKPLPLPHWDAVMKPRPLYWVDWLLIGAAASIVLVTIGGAAIQKGWVSCCGF